MLEEKEVHGTRVLTLDNHTKRNFIFFDSVETHTKCFINETKFFAFIPYRLFCYASFVQSFFVLRFERNSEEYQTYSQYGLIFDEKKKLISHIYVRTSWLRQTFLS